MNHLINLLICPDCHNKILPYGEAWLCAGCGRVFRENGGILSLLPAGEDSDAKTRERLIYDNAKKLYGQFGQLHGARKVIADWSLIKIEDTNYEIVKPYLNGCDVLEIGCGRGYLTAKVSQLATVVALDISMGSLEYAKELGNLNGVFYFQGDVHSIPFESESFDVVIISEVLEHLPDLDRAIAEIRRVLKSGGLVMASVPNSMMYLYPLSLLSSVAFGYVGVMVLIRRLKREADDGSGQYHRPFLPGQFKKLFQSSGFKVLEHRTSMLHLWRFPYIRLIQYGDRHYSTANKTVVGLIIKVSDFLLDRGFPLLRWVGIRQHLLARKEDI